MPDAQITDPIAQAAFEAATLAVKGGLTRVQFAELAKICADEAASPGDDLDAVVEAIDDFECLAPEHDEPADDDHDLARDLADDEARERAAIERGDF